MLQTPAAVSRRPPAPPISTRGRGDETVVLIHGVGMRIEALGAADRAAGRDSRVVAVDLPGHGVRGAARARRRGSSISWTGSSALLDELELGPVNVAGHSMGALIADRHRGDSTGSKVKPRGAAQRRPSPQRNTARAAACRARRRDREWQFRPRSAVGALVFRRGEERAKPMSWCMHCSKLVDRQGYATAYRAFATRATRSIPTAGRYRDCPGAVSSPATVILNSTPDMARRWQRPRRGGQGDHRRPSPHGQPHGASLQ